jgi:hypothetical protein
VATRRGRPPYPFLAPCPRRRRSADLATIRRMAERADALAAFLELARRPAEAIAAANIAAGLRQAIP